MKTRKLMEKLANKVRNFDGQDDLPRKMEQNYAAILTPTEIQSGPEALREDVKKIQKDEKISLPRDVTLTKQNNLVIKMKGKAELDER